MYKHNKQVKNKANMVLWAILGLLVGFYIGMSAFIWGFRRGAFSEPLQVKQTSGIQQQAWTVPLQADSVNLQPTVQPTNEQGRLVKDNTLSITMKNGAIQPINGLEFKGGW